MQSFSSFSNTYQEARKKFRNAARHAGAKLKVLDLGLRGPEGEKLCIDIAWVGKSRASLVFLHSSGIHGIEGYAGSAVQIDFLQNLPRIPRQGALVIVHCLNPYGMAYMRRVNENNVDLNRNFLSRKERWIGAHPGYHKVHSFLNPASYEQMNNFMLKLYWKVFRYGFKNLKQAGGQGQYEYPRGLFFGGHHLERGPRMYLKWMYKKLKKVKQLCILDVHTGVGDPGEDWLILERNIGGRFHKVLSAIYGDKLDIPGRKDSVVYEIRGGMEVAIPRLLPEVECDYITQEFGTVAGPLLLKALRDENYFHLAHSDKIDLNHWSKHQIKNAFAPPTDSWARLVLRGGRRAIDLSLDHLFAAQ